MRKKKKSIVNQTAFLPPGQAVHVGERIEAFTELFIFDYDENSYTEKTISSVDECSPFRETPAATWLNVVGIHDAALIEKLGAAFGLHPLVIEDILNTSQRPKVEDYGDYLYIVLKSFRYTPNNGGLEPDQISIVLGRGFVITFEERKGPTLDTIRDRIRNKKGRVRLRGPDYLAYTLMDAIVDGYFVLLEALETEVDEIEEMITADPGPHAITRLHRLKQTLIAVRKSVWPLRDSVNTLDRVGGHLIDPGTHAYLRDLYDHTNQVIDTIETVRDTLSVLMDIHLSSLNIRISEVMKMLAIIGTIFIPLTFLAGVYGMNFQYFPELHWHYGYLVFWIICFAVAGVMVYYFRKNRWL